MTLQEITEQAQREAIRASLGRSSGNLAHAAGELGVTPGGLLLTLRRLGLGEWYETIKRKPGRPPSSAA